MLILQTPNQSSVRFFTGTTGSEKSSALPATNICYRTVLVSRLHFPAFLRTQVLRVSRPKNFHRRGSRHRSSAAPARRRKLRSAFLLTSAFGREPTAGL